jgi:hypothetical protein
MSNLKSILHAQGVDYNPRIFLTPTQKWRQTNKPCFSEMQGLFEKTKIDLKIHATCETTIKNTDVPENLRPAGVEANPAAPAVRFAVGAPDTWRRR